MNKRTIFTVIAAIFTGIITSLPFGEAVLPTEHALLERTDSFNNQNVLRGDTPQVLNFTLTNNFTESITVDAMDLFGNMDVDDNIDLTFTGSGFSFTGNTGTLTGSGTVLNLATGSGFTLAPGESKEISTTAAIPADTTMTSFQLNISDMTLSSGSGVSLVSGSGISLSNPLSGGTFNVFPSTFTVNDQFPQAGQTLIATDTKITGTIAGTFDLTDFDFYSTIEENSSPFSNYSAVFDKNNRTFEITLNTDFAEEANITVDILLSDESISITGPSITFVANTPSIDFGIDQSLNQDFVLPIDVDNQEFDTTNQIVLLPETEIDGVSAGLVVSIPAGTNISKNPSSVSTWTGEMLIPVIRSVPSQSLFDSAVGLPSGKTFTPSKRFSIGSPNVSIIFDQAVSFTIPITGSGDIAIYYSQDGTSWTRETSCTIDGGGFCNFQTNHFTEFTLGTESVTTSQSGGASHGSSRQNHVRHGEYDPRNLAKQFSPPQPNVQTILRGQSSKARLKYIPCEIDENDIMTNALNNLKLSQGANKMCREDYEKFEELPYRSFIR